MNIYEQSSETKMKYVGSGLCTKDYSGYTEKYCVLGIIRKKEGKKIGGLRVNEI